MPKIDADAVKVKLVHLAESLGGRKLTRDEFDQIERTVNLIAGPSRSDVIGTIGFILGQPADRLMAAIGNNVSDQIIKEILLELGQRNKK